MFSTRLPNSMLSLREESFKYMKKRPIQDRSRATVSAILEATAQLLGQSSVEGVTTEHIARHAGVSVGSIYQYFESKEMIIVALAAGTVGRLNEMVRQTLDTAEPDDMASAIAPIVDALIRAHEEEPERVGFLIEHMVSRGQIGPLDQSAHRLEVWLTNYLVAVGYADEPVARIRSRITVLGVTAVLRGTYIHAPAEISSPVFREELIRFLYGMLTGRFETI